jgi:tRNA threonylcarbamoyladenosine biosynthesis protein TsaE
MTVTLTTHSVEETRDLGAQLASVLVPGVVIVAAGGLGVGKTAMAQGLARGLGVTGRVTSPTFTLLASHRANNSRGITTMLHADLYRTVSGEEVDDLAIGELVESGAVCFVEWGDLAPDVLGAQRIFVSLSQGELDDDRIIAIETQTTAVAEGALAEALGGWAS